MSLQEHLVQSINNQNEVIISPTKSTVYLKYIHVNENLILERAPSVCFALLLFSSIVKASQ